VAHDHVHLVLEQWRRELPELDRAPMGVVGRISRLSQLLDAEIEPVFAEHGLNGGEFDVLAALRRSGEPHRLTPTQLSGALMVTSGGMTKRLASLESRGLVGRSVDRVDKRSKWVVLTAEGRRVVERALDEHVANEARLLAPLARAKRSQLAALLEELAVALGDEPYFGGRERA
jgi:DNA-binding MarR family transcriptional regulator